MGKIAVTFDDAPGAMTNTVLDILEKHNVKATFFVQGNRIKKLKDIKCLLRMKKMQCEIGNHSWSHVRFSSCSLRRIKVEIRLTDMILRFMRISCDKVRTPYGENDEKIRMALGHRKNVLWNVYSQDAKGASAYEIKNIIYEKTSENDILLFHVWCDETIKVLDEIIGFLKNRYELVTVDALLR